MPPRARAPSPGAPGKKARLGDERGGGLRPVAASGAGGRGGEPPAQPLSDSPRLTGKRSARKRASWLPPAAAPPAGSCGASFVVKGSAAAAAPATATAAAAPAGASPLRATAPGAATGAPRNGAAAAAFGAAATAAASSPFGGSGRGGNGGPLRPPSAHGIEASAARTKAALGARHAQLCTSADGLHFFAGEASGALVLPRAGEHEHLLDSKLAAVAAAEGAINAVPGCDTYVVVRTMPDGNCLSHACSLGVWGVHDHDAELRRAISCTMAAPGAGGATRARFVATLARLGIPSSEWELEWRREIEVFNGSLRGGRGPPTLSRGFLSDVHCFVLANVLRRPLIIYGGPVAMEAGLAGVYLPLLWQDCDGADGTAPPCSRVPTSLLFHRSHFSVLATLEGGARAEAPPPTRARARDAPQPPPTPCTPRLPLAVRVNGRTQALPVRFLLPEEEEQAEALLRRWLDVVPPSATSGLPPGVAAFALPTQASADALMSLVDATVRNEC